MTAILGSMLARRLVLAVLVLAVAFAPAALEACEAECAMHAEATVMQHHGERASVVAAAHHHNAAKHPDHAVRVTGPHGRGTARFASSVSAPAHPRTRTDGFAVNSAPHTCGHTEDLPVIAGASVQIAVAAPAILTNIGAITHPRRIGSPIRTGAPPRDSVPIAVTLPLRV
jgi:hypothetical protein